MEHRAGSFTSQLYGQMAYQSFRPSPLPPDPAVSVDEEMMHLLVQSHTWIAKLESSASLIPHMALFVSMYVRKEALLSSQIEGTQCTLEDVLDPAVEANANRDVADVINSIKATDYAIDRLQTLPLCNRLIRETHAVLLQGVRGEESRRISHLTELDRWGRSLFEQGIFHPSPPRGHGCSDVRSREIPPCSRSS